MQTRRDFLKLALATSATGIAPFNILKAGPSPNGKLNIACIGVGKMGSKDASYLATYNNVIGLCDVDEPRHRKCIAKKKNLHGVPFWNDYRVMYDKIGKEIDAIYVGTPEHVHFAASMFAINRDKHVYTQKPLCHTLNECRILTEEANKHKVITQMGNQGHSTRSSAMIRDWVHGGSIGEVKEVVAYSRKNYWTKTMPTGTSPIPKGFDWNLFLNRAEMIPFNTGYINREWIRFSHFSGVVGDMGAHILDGAYYSLDLRVPLSVHAKIDNPPGPGLLPKSGVITWEFGARGTMPPVTMTFHLGPDIPYPFPKHLEKGRRPIKSGSVIVGKDASVMAGSHSQGARIIPEVTMRATPRPKKEAFRCKEGNHFKNWTNAIKGIDKEAMSNFDYAGPLSEIIILGDIAMMHPNEKLVWDSKKMEITNHDAANKSIFMRRLNPRDDLNWI